MNDQFLGNYRVKEKIGAGGMARVYLGEHKDVTSFKVVLKVLTDPRLIERFRQEADKLALLDGHPNVCQIKDFFSHGDDAVIAMEYIDGESLEDLLQQHDPMPIGEAVRIMADVVGVLEFAHERGIYHRDIKPSNIMIDKKGQVKIIDFGIAKGKSDPNLTTAGALCGTPAYMAPEQFTSTDDTNFALVDVYAVGTTLFRLVCGKMPFEGENEFILRDAKLFNDPPKPRSLNGTITQTLEKVLLKSLAKEPLDRYPSMTEFRHALVQARGDKVDTTPTHAPTVATVGKPGRDRSGGAKRSALPKVLLGIAIVAVLAVAGYFVFGPSGPEAPPAPPVPQLVSPSDGAVITNTRQPVLAWSSAGLTANVFELELATDSLFTDAVPFTGLRGRSCSLSEDLANGVYYWRVFAVDASGALGEPSESYSFTIDKVSSGEGGKPVAEIPTGVLSLTVDPSGDIYLGDRRVARGQASYSAELDTGVYAVRVENSEASERVLRDSLRVREGATTRREFAFTMPPPEPVVTTGEVRVGSRPRGADIYINGELQPQQTPYT
ncbi:protein kinase, partial [candidate division GN15 bacterium]|nr:protein kinase [candidate division GN15 bacterium]